MVMKGQVRRIGEHDMRAQAAFVAKAVRHRCLTCLPLLPLTVGYKVCSTTTNFVWRARRLLHPIRFTRVVEGGLSGLHGAEGFFWLAKRMACAGS